MVLMYYVVVDSILCCIKLCLCYTTRSRGCGNKSPTKKSVNEFTFVRPLSLMPPGSSDDAVPTTVHTTVQMEEVSDGTVLLWRKTVLLHLKFYRPNQLQYPSKTWTLTRR